MSTSDSERDGELTPEEVCDGIIRAATKFLFMLEECSQSIGWDYSHRQKTKLAKDMVGAIMEMGEALEKLDTILVKN